MTKLESNEALNFEDEQDSDFQKNPDQSPKLELIKGGEEASLEKETKENPVNSLIRKFKNLFRKKIDFAPEKKEFAHAQKMFEIWEKIKNSDPKFAEINPRIKNALCENSNARAFSMLIRTNKLKQDEVFKLIDEYERAPDEKKKKDELYLGINEKMKEVVDKQVLDTETKKMVEKVALIKEKALPSFEALSSYDVYEKAFKDFGNLSKKEHDFLAGTLCLDLEALHAEGKIEAGLFPKFERFMKARENFDKINDSLRGLEQRYLDELEQDPNNFLKDLKKEDDVKDEQGKKLQEKIYDMKHIPNVSDEFKDALEKEFKPKHWLILEKYTKIKEALDKGNKPQAVEILRTNALLTNDQVEKAIEIVKASKVDS